MSDDREERESASHDEAVEPAPGKTLDDLVHQKDSFTIWDEYQEAYGDPAPLRIETAPDTGMPNLAAEEDSAAHAPRLSHEWNVCIADLRSFVIRDSWGDVIATFDPVKDEIQQTPTGVFRVKLELALERCRPWLEEVHGGELAMLGRLSRIEELGRLTRIEVNGYPRGFVEVQPVRPACAHQLLQLRPPGAGEPLEFGYLKRYCTVRRSTAGAFLELTDDSMRSCSMRSPMDEASVDLLRRFDERKVELGKHRVLLPLFNVAVQAEKRKNGGAPEAKS